MGKSKLVENFKLAPLIFDGLQSGLRLVRHFRILEERCVCNKDLMLCMRLFATSCAKIQVYLQKAIAVLPTDSMDSKSCSMSFLF
jgi:hypothetical protein